MDQGTLLNRFMSIIVDRLDDGFVFLQQDVMWLFNSLVLAQIALAGVYWALGADRELISEVLRRILVIGFILYLIQTFPIFVDIVAKTGVQLGLKAGGSRISYDQMIDPGEIADLGWVSATRIWDEVSNLTGPIGSYINIKEIILLIGAGVVVLISFIAVAFQMFFAMVALKLGALVVYVLLPFAAFPATAMIAERPLGWLVASAVRLMLITIVVSVSFALFTDLTVHSPDDLQLREAIGIAAGSVVVFIFSWQASRLAQDIASGIPSFGLGSALTTVAAGAATGVAAGSVVNRASRVFRTSKTDSVDAVQAAAKTPPPSNSSTPNTVGAAMVAGGAGAKAAESKGK